MAWRPLKRVAWATLPKRRVAARAVHKRTILFMGCGFDDVKIVFFNRITK
jgi:hypothetical protein